MTEPPRKHVTVEECLRKHRTTQYMLSAILVLGGFFIWAAQWAVSAGQSAREVSAEVRGELKTHIARQEERDVRIDENLARMTKMIEDMWQQRTVKP